MSISISVSKCGNSETKTILKDILFSVGHQLSLISFLTVCSTFGPSFVKKLGALTYFHIVDRSIPGQPALVVTLSVR